MSDPGNLICGITIDVTPLYPNASIKKRCRSQLWEGDEVNSKLRIVLERGGIESMTRFIKSQFTSPNYLRVCAEATGEEFTDDDERELFALKIDIFGDATLLDPLSDIVGDIATAETICDDLRPLLVRYVAESLPDITLKWQLEPTEYGE